MKRDYKKEMVAEAITVSATHLAEIVGEKIAYAVTKAVSDGLIAQPALVDGELVYTPERAAKLLGISQDTVYTHLLREPGFPAKKIGSRYLISAQGLFIWVNQMSIEEDD